jgi:hypothetical protein
MMACKYLSESKVSRCLASQWLMIPSSQELSDYCRGDFEACPVYCSRESEVKKEMEIAGQPSNEQTRKAG